MAPLYLVNKIHNTKTWSITRNHFNQTQIVKGDECKPIAYYKMSVSYEIEGGFTNYVNFRNILANKSKIVNIENEEIKKNENISGLIKATATVSLVKNREMN